jgi:hypothetical protein
MRGEWGGKEGRGMESMKRGRRVGLREIVRGKVGIGGGREWGYEERGE